MPTKTQPEQREPIKTEIEVLGDCMKMLDAMPDVVSRARVVGYLHGKYMTEAIEKAAEAERARRAVPKTA